MNVLIYCSMLFGNVESSLLIVFLCFRNQIVNLTDSYYLNFRNTLTTLFLGENQITTIPNDFFSSFKRLLWLNLDNNHIREVSSHSLASTIHTLSLSSNQIRSFPLEAIESLTSLTWFKLRGNYIETIPELPFRHVIRFEFLRRCTANCVQSEWT